MNADEIRETDARAAYAAFWGDRPPRRFDDLDDVEQQRWKAAAVEAQRRALFRVGLPIDA